jgi:uncharacterized coiled-coil protein SlyX
MSEGWQKVLWGVIGAGAIGLAAQLWKAPTITAVLEQRVSAQEAKSRELSDVPIVLERLEVKLNDVIERLRRVEQKQDEAPQPATHERKR